jgi:hypothetical protein
VAAVAIGSITSMAGSDSNTAVMCGLAMGVVAAVTSRGGLVNRAAEVAFTVIGVIAFFPAAVAFVRADTCRHAIAAPLRFAMLALLIILAVLSFVARRLMVGNRPHASTGLSLFGALQILIATTTFIEGSGSRPELLAMAAMIPGAAVLGWFVATAPTAVLNVSAVVFGLQAIYAAAVHTGCGQQNFSGAVLLIVFIGAFSAARAVLSSLSPRR